MDDKLPLKGVWSGFHDSFSVWMPTFISQEQQKQELPNVVCKNILHASLRMTDGQDGQGYVTHFLKFCPNHISLESVKLGTSNVVS